LWISVNRFGFKNYNFFSLTEEYFEGRMEDNEDVCSTYLILPDQPIIIETVNVDIIGKSDHFCLPWDSKQILCMVI